MPTVDTTILYTETQASFSPAKPFSLRMLRRARGGCRSLRAELHVALASQPRWRFPVLQGTKRRASSPAGERLHTRSTRNHMSDVYTHAQAATAHTYRANNNTIVCRTFQLASGLCRVGFIPGSLERKGRATKRLLTHTRVRSALFAPKLYTLKLFRYFPSACVPIYRLREISLVRYLERCVSSRKIVPYTRR